MERFTVRLERVFHGPMDLLLHLVREQEVEIQDVEISSVLEGYMEHLEHLKGVLTQQGEGRGKITRRNSSTTSYTVEAMPVPPLPSYLRTY